MRRSLSLSTRTFLLTFFAICSAQLAGVFITNAALKNRIKDGLMENLRSTQQQLDLQEAEYNHHATELIATLSENSGLKAAVGLSREESVDPQLRAQVRGTIEDQIRQLSHGLDFDLYMVIDAEGTVIASVGPQVDAEEARQVAINNSSGPWLIRAGNNLYKVTTVPINLDTENIGKLAVGRKFQIGTPGAFGYAVLTDPSGIVASTLPASVNSEVGRQLAERCGNQENGCEVTASGHEYLALEMDRDWVTSDYHLLRLASIDDAMRSFTEGLWQLYLARSFGGVVLAFLFALFASVSISRPLAALASNLESSGETGALWNEFPVDSTTREVNLLAGALNRAASARRQVEYELLRAKEFAESATSQVKVTYDETLEALGAALDLRDNETAGHSHRVTRYSLELAKRIGVVGDQLKHIERGAYLHDIGKIGTPDAILLKPGKLTPEERQVMQEHARVGYELVSRIEFLHEAAEIVYAHQERFDGKGYPRGLKGEDIPLGARIFAVADTFDAMTSDRPYRKALSLAVALEEINSESGRQFDPDVVRVLNNIPAGVWDGIRREVAGLGGSVASKRAPLETNVVCKRGELRFNSTSLNISESGILLESPIPLSVGEELGLEFYLPDISEPLTPRVQVVRREPRGVGVRFVTLTREAREGIRQYTGAAAKVEVNS
jgi:putative nucleotidyltransferase with HDIG domain